MIRTLVPMATLAALAIMASACTPLKTRDAERNEGGGSSMYRAVDLPRAR